MKETILENKKLRKPILKLRRLGRADIFFVETLMNKFATPYSCGCFRYGMKYIIDKFGNCWEEYGIACGMVDFKEDFGRAQTHLLNYHSKYFEVIQTKHGKVYLFNRTLFKPEHQ